MEIITDFTTRCIKPKGRLDANSSYDLDRALMAFTEIAQDLVIDLSECPYVSSAGIRILLKTKKKLQPGLNELYLAGVAPDVFRVFEIAGLDSIFRFEISVEAALAQVESGRQKKKGITEIDLGHHKLVYHPIGDDNIRGQCINSKKIVSFEDLGYAIGFGSFSEAEENLSGCTDFFASTKKGVGFIPPETSGDPDFRIVLNPEKADTLVCEVLSFGQRPSGVMKLSSPGILTFSQINEAVDSLTGKIFLPGSAILRIVANFDKNAPSVSVFIANDGALSDVISKAGLNQLAGLFYGKNSKNAFIGMRLLLSSLEIPSKDMAPEEILRHNLTFENLLAVKPFSIGNFLENPVIWLFAAGSFITGGK